MNDEKQAIGNVVKAMLLNSGAIALLPSGI
jgi:hypothetical protein